MAKLSQDELLDAFKEMTLVELSEFVKAFEEAFDVEAAAPVAAAAAAPAAGGAAPEEEEKTEFDVVLSSVGDAKGLVDSAPKAVLEKASKEDAEKAKTQLEEAGATVELK